MALRGPGFPLVFALVAAAGLGAAGIEAAWGGAWLMPPGEGQVIAYTAFSESNRAFDDQGHLIPVPAYKKFELGAYVEYGVTNWLTPSSLLPPMTASAILRQGSLTMGPGRANSPPE
jgi:hypothetical protein